MDRFSELREGAGFWAAIGAPGVGLAAVLTYVGASTNRAGAADWSNGLFDVGVAVALLAVLALLWAVVLHLAHRHAQGRRHSGDPPAPHDFLLGGWREMDAERKRRYAAVHGLFLTHELNSPPAASGRVVDVRIHLVQHRTGPLTDGTVESVEYVLGVHFTPPTRLITDPTGGYVLEESIYYPVLVLARVRFKDGAEPLLLEHYVHLAQGTPSASSAPGS